MPFLFELAYSGRNAFHITLTHFCTIDFKNVAETQSILGFESNVLVKRLDNLRRYFLSTVCNQVVVMNGTVRHVLTMPTGYYTYLEFIEAVGSEMMKVLTIVSMAIIEEEYVKLNVQEEGHRERDDMTMDGFGWALWFTLSPSINGCVWSVLWMVLCVRSEWSILA